MKIEFIEEIKFGRDPWYEIRIDGFYKWGSFQRDQAEAMYEGLKKNPNIIMDKINILKCEEIILPSEENKTETP
jgi:hypothetical protein